MYQFACVFSLLDLESMVLRVVICYLGMGFSRCDSVFSLALPFLYSFDEMGSHTLVDMDDRIGFEVEWGGSPK